MTPECRHIKTSGGKCSSYALRDQPYCYFHSRQRERAAQQMPSALSLAFTSLEDRGAIQHAICEVSIALIEHRLDAKQASSLLYALQIASSNLKEAEQIVCSESVAEVTRSERGEEMAPEGATSRPEQEESIADLLLKGIYWPDEEIEKLRTDQRPQPITEKRIIRKPQGEGGSPPAEIAVEPIDDEVSAQQAPVQQRDDQISAWQAENQIGDGEADEPESFAAWPLDEFGHPKPLWN